MRYKNANNILPPELIEAIQQYIQGEYIYIPIKDKTPKTAPTVYKVELQKRDEHIYTKSLEGVSNKALSAMYNLSEPSIRRIIIKQKRRYKDMENRIKAALSHWNVEFESVTQIYDTAWQVDENYVLKLYKSSTMLERNIKMITILDSMNIPVARIIPTKEHVNFAKDDYNFYILTERLSGNNIVSLKNNQKIAFEMGKIIANLHLAFRECEKIDTFKTNSLLGELNGWIRKALQEDGWKMISEEQFCSTVTGLETFYENLPVQLIHRDVHFGNFLFDNDEFSGYIDFDLSQRNIRIFDLCYFMLGLLSEEEKMDITSEEWFQVLEAVFDGYQRVINLSIEEIKAVPYVMEAIELLFAAWFLKQDDVKCVENAVRIYEFINDNKSKIIDVINQNCSE